MDSAEQIMEQARLAAEGQRIIRRAHDRHLVFGTERPEARREREKLHNRVEGFNLAWDAQEDRIEALTKAIDTALADRLDHTAQGDGYAQLVNRMRDTLRAVRR